MKINTIINRYIFCQMIPPFVVSVLFFTFVFLMTKILDITNLIVNYSIGISSVLLLLLYSVPRFLEFVIPISIMTAVLVTFLRLSGDNEITACKTSGIGIYALTPPVMLFCIVGCILTCVITIYGIPWGRLSFKQLTYKVAASHLSIGLKERTFNDNFKDVMLYVNRIDLQNRTLLDVFIEDQRDKDVVSTIVSPKGELFCDQENRIFQLRLYNGTINQVDIERKTVHSIRFKTYDVNLDLHSAVEAAKKRAKNEEEMSLKELREYIRKTASAKDSDYYGALIVFHKKFSIPFACIALGILALPLGIHTSLTKRSYGLGLLFIILYYLLLSAGFVFGEAGFYPPVIGMWVPNIVTSGIGFFLLTRQERFYSR